MQCVDGWWTADYTGNKVPAGLDLQQAMVVSCFLPLLLLVNLGILQELQVVQTSLQYTALTSSWS